MSIISVNFLRISSSSESSEGEKTLTHTYQVISNDPTESDITVRNANGIPPLGSLNSGDVTMTVRRRSPKLVSDSRTVWEVDVEYSNRSQDGEEEDEDKTDNPLEDRVKRTNTDRTETRAALKDKDGILILNSAKKPIDPPLTRLVVIDIFTFVRNQASFNALVNRSYKNRVNSTDFLGFPARTILCRSITGFETFERNMTYWPHTYVFEYDEEGWDRPRLEQGYDELVENDGTEDWEPCLDALGQQVSSPAALDADGAQIDADSLPEAAVETIDEIIKEAEFNDLQLPQG